MNRRRVLLAFVLSSACGAGPSGDPPGGSTGATEVSSSSGTESASTGLASTSGPTADASSGGETTCEGSTPYGDPDPEPWTYALVSEAGRLPQVFVPRISGDGRYVVFGSDIRADGTAETLQSRYLVRADNACGSLETLLLTGLDPEDLTMLDQLELSGDGGHLALTIRRGAVLEAYGYEIDTDALVPLHRDAGGAPLEGFLGGLRLTPDGSHVLMTSGSAGLVPADDDMIADVFVRPWAEPEHDLISVNTEGVKSNLDSGNGAITPDARFVVFDSAGPNMRPNAVGGSHVYVRDRIEGTTEPVSPEPPVAQQAFQGGYRPQISDDGRFVAFISVLDHVPEDVDEPDRDDVYLVDRTTEAIQLVTGAVAADAAVADLVMSADGGRMTFWTNSFDSPRAMWVWDAVTGELRDVRTDGAGTVDDGETLFDARVSRDGRWLVTLGTGSNQIEPAGDPSARLIVRSLDALF